MFAPLGLVVVLIGIAAIVLDKPPPFTYHGHVVNPSPVVKFGALGSPGSGVSP